MVVGLAVALAVLTIAALTALSDADHGLTDPFYDPAATFGFSPRHGAVSQLGVMAWAAAAALCLWGAADPLLDGRLRRWLLRAGIVTFALAVDDAFLGHEQLTMLLGADEKAVLAVIGLLITIGLAPGFRYVWPRPERTAVLVTLALLSTSVGFDVLESRLSALTGVSTYAFSYLEECFKLLGIAAWLGTVTSLLRSR